MLRKSHTLAVLALVSRILLGCGDEAGEGDAASDLCTGASSCYGTIGALDVLCHAPLQDVAQEEGQCDSECPERG